MSRILINVSYRSFHLKDFYLFINFYPLIIFQAANIPIDFEKYYISELSPEKSTPLELVVQNIRRNGICLKGILASPDKSGTGELATLNMLLRNELDLYANVVHVKTLPGVKTRYNKINLPQIACFLLYINLKKTRISGEKSYIKERQP